MALGADLVAKLVAILGPNGCLTEPQDVAPYLTDYRGRRRGDAIAVALPSTTEEAAAAVALATGAGVPVFPQGGNTGLCYGAVPKAGLVIGMRRMRKIRHIDPDSALMTVDAGVPLAEIHSEADRHGLQFPLYLGSEGSAQIGGLIATNAGGTGVLRYGSTRDLVAGIEAVLSDGRVLSDLGGLRKNNTGFNMAQLFAGSEGALGIITGAVLRLSPKIQARASAWVACPSAAAAVELGNRVRLALGTEVEALELLDAAQVRHVTTNASEIKMPFSAIPEWSLLIEVGSSRAGDNLIPQLETVLGAALEDGLIPDAVIAQNEAQAEEIWHFRHSVTEANARQGVGVVLDTSVRTSAIADFVAAADAVTSEQFPEAERAIVAHMADGNVHYIVMFPREVWNGYPDPEAKELEVERAIHDVAAAHGGTFSAEHGIGRKLTAEMDRLIDPVRLDLMRSIKAAFDPKNLMNPGVLLPPKP